jgi:hypothetical protein
MINNLSYEIAKRETESNRRGESMLSRQVDID